MKPENRKNETVVLLHGIGHSLWNMVALERGLKKAGYKTLNLTYPSTRHNIETLSGWLSDQIAEKQVWEDSDKVHFVAHSMGGLLTGTYLQENKDALPPEKMGRVVMLGTPHGGSEVADLLKDFPPYQWLFGPAGQQLTTAFRKENRIIPWYDLGIIAGSHGWAYPFGLYAIKDENDGCVSVESTKLKGMKDHIVLPVLHGIMGWNKMVQRHVLRFLEEGKFEEASLHKRQNNPECRP